MKIFISADMEGATGVVYVDQTNTSKKEYSFGCKMQLHDVKAVIEGALSAGADEILVNDSHSIATNLDVAELGFDSRVRLLSGSPKMFSMVHGVEGADCQAPHGLHNTLRVNEAG